MTDTQTAESTADPIAEKISNDAPTITGNAPSWAAALTEQVANLAAAVERIGGYAAQEEWTWVECEAEGLWEGLKPREGGEPLRVEVRDDLLNYEVAAIPTADGTPYRDLWRAITPHIRAWNVKQLDLVTGEWRDVPPPRVMGVEAFDYVKPLAGEWMGFVLKFATMRRRNLPKASPPHGGGQNSPSAPASDSSSPAKASRKGRTAST